MQGGRLEEGVKSQHLAYILYGRPVTQQSDFSGQRVSFRRPKKRTSDELEMAFENEPEKVEEEEDDRKTRPLKCQAVK